MRTELERRIAKVCFSVCKCCPETHITSEIRAVAARSTPCTAHVLHNDGNRRAKSPWALALHTPRALVDLCDAVFLP